MWLVQVNMEELQALRESAKAMPLLLPEAARLEEVLSALDAWQGEAKQAVLRKPTAEQLQGLLLTAAGLPVDMPQVASMQVCGGAPSCLFGRVPGGGGERGGGEGRAIMG